MLPATTEYTRNMCKQKQTKKQKSKKKNITKPKSLRGSSFKSMLDVPTVSQDGSLADNTNGAFLHTVIKK